MFKSSFWSPGYSDGVEVLYNKLAQGIGENNEVIAFFTARAEAELAHGIKLSEMNQTFQPKKSGFARDDGASMRKAYEGILAETEKEGSHHVQIAQNLERMVIQPFTKWAEDHKTRVTSSREALRAKVKHYNQELSEAHKSQKKYLNKCRQLEDFKERESQEGQTNEEEVVIPNQSKGDFESTTTEITSQELQLGGRVYSNEDSQELVARLVNEIPQQDVKVPILGTYKNVSNGAAITTWIQSELVTGLENAEKMGQELVDAGLLRLVGQPGQQFANSSVMKYQWRPRAYELAGLSHASHGSSLDTLLGGSLSETISETLGTWGGRRNQSDDLSGERLVGEVRELDHKYRKSVAILDGVRCQLEELIVEHVDFMERCELHRLKALKAATLDFVAAISNVAPNLQATVDKLLLYQETMNPANDLRFIVEAYRTGHFAPRVTVYDNYYSSADGNVFGMDLELRCRGDRKHVPLIVSTVLSYLDKQYPLMHDDHERVALWSQYVGLKDMHALRRMLNTFKAIDKSALEKFEPAVVASVLKLYFQELPDAVIPCQYYDVLKAIYSNQGASSDSRVQAVQNTLMQLRVTNIATLDAVTAHFKRLISIAAPDEEALNKLAKELGSCLLYPRVQNSLTMSDSFVQSLMRDLLECRDKVFHELKQSVQPRLSSDDRRRRKPSIDERVSSITRHISESDYNWGSRNGGRNRSQSQNDAQGQESQKNRYSSTSEVNTKDSSPYTANESTAPDSNNSPQTHDTGSQTAGSPSHTGAQGTPESPSPYNG